MMAGAPPRRYVGLARDWLDVWTARRLHRPPKSLPLLYIDVTARCQLRCRYCGFAASYPRARAELSTDEILSLLRQAAALDTRIVSFGGGEPFLRRDIGELLTAAANLGLTVHVNSNGLALDGDHARVLAGIPSMSLVLSLDHPEAARNDAIRGGGAFEGVRQAVQRVRAGAPAVRIGVNTVLGPHNHDVLEELVRLVAGWGVSSIKLLPVEDGLNHAWREEGLPRELRWTVDDRASLAKRLAAFRRAARRRGLMTNSAFFLRGIPNALTGRVPHRCYAGFLFASVDPYGYVFPCYTHRDPPGDLRLESLADIWFGARMQQLRHRVVHCGESCWCSGNAEPSWRMEPRAWLREPRQVWEDLRFYS